MRCGAVNGRCTRGLVLCTTGFVIEAVPHFGRHCFVRPNAGKGGCREGDSSDQADTSCDGGQFGKGEKHGFTLPSRERIPQKGQIVRGNPIMQVDYAGGLRSPGEP